MTRTTLWISIVLCSVVATVAPACGDDNSNGSDGDSDSDSDSDNDSDSDTDTDPLNCAGGRYDEINNLCWQDPEAPGEYTHDEAVDYCEALDLEGHDNWSLPSRDEFVDLLGGCDEDVLNGEIGYCRSCAESPTCDAMFYDVDQHWSSTMGDHPWNHWYADFYSGLVNDEEESQTYITRCVRTVE